MREQLRPLNINVTVEPLEIGTFATHIGDGTFQWASTGRGMRGDPSGFVVDFRSGTANHVKWFGDGWSNEEIDALYDEALATSDQAQRLEAYQQIQQIIAEDVPNLYTSSPPSSRWPISGSRACTSRTRISTRGCGPLA